MGESKRAWRTTIRRRVLVVAALLGLWACGIEARLVDLQVLRHADLVARAERQQSGTRTTPAKRGDILDRNGHVLATSADVDTIYAVPSEIDDAAGAVGQLCRAFGDCTTKERDALVDRLTRQRAFAYVRRQVSPDEARKVADLNLQGIGFMKESRRFYPNKDLAAAVLGYVGLDGNGLSGVESTYDKEIRGKSGTVLIHTDARGHAFSRTERPATSGATIELTIDEYIQHIVERELQRDVAENHAEGATAIVMNPHTGEILAMASEPTFNPNTYRDFDEASRRNRAVQDLYEPGSTFKVVTASAAIEEHVMPLDTLIDTRPGRIQIGSRVVHDTENHGVLSFTDVIVESSNVGAIKIGFKIGPERLSRYVSLYGFGHPTCPDFPGESPGIVWAPDKWTDSALMSVSMGYQVGVTALQMVAAVSAVANGGEYVEPRILREVDENSRRYAVQPKVVRRTTSADTAATLTGIMEDVVVRGTGKAAQIPGYTVAGKTGTAAKLVDHHYSHSDYNASFVGFVPSRNPAIAVIVVTDSPHGRVGYYGGSVSAPVFERIAEATLRYLGIGPTIDPPAPVLVERQPGPSGVPTADSAATTQPVVSLVADGAPGTVPDVHGMSAREAVRTLVRAGLDARVTGDGFVIAQNPPAGAPLDPGAVCRLVLDRRSAQAEQVQP